MRRFLLDASDSLADRWMMFHLAERDAWKTVELYLLQRLIERRVSENELDAWGGLMPFGEDLLDAIRQEYEHYGGFDWPAEPQGFDVRALLELRSARLAGELYTERPGYQEVDADPVEGSATIIRDFVSILAERFGHLAQVVQHEDLDVHVLALDYLSHRLRTNDEMRAEFGAIADVVLAAASPSSSSLANMLCMSPELVEELIGDVLADSMLRQSRRLEESRRNSKPVTREEAEVEVRKILGQSEEIQATTLADAVAQAERLKDTHNILLAMNSLWAWYSALPEDQQQAIGTFEGKRPHIKLWSAARLRVQRGEQL